MSKKHPLHNINWWSGMSYVRIMRNRELIINRSYYTLEEAIQARDYTLQHGEPPPPDRPRAAPPELFSSMLQDLANRTRNKLDPEEPTSS
jgi:hypothetical protein